MEETDLVAAISDVFLSNAREVTLRELLTWSQYAYLQGPRKLYAEGRKLLLAFQAISETVSP
jgi:hypothetical protein